MRFVVALLIAVGLGLAVNSGGEAMAEPPTTHEILSDRPSGFWTSNRPAEGGAYRWRLLGIGVALIGVTGFAILRVIKRAKSQRPGS